MLFSAHQKARLSKEKLREPTGLINRDEATKESAAWKHRKELGAGGATTCDQQQLQAAAETAQKNCIYLDLFVHRPRYDICTCMEKHDLIDFAVLTEELAQTRKF